MLALVADLEVIVKNKVLFWSPLPWPVLLEICFKQDFLLDVHLLTSKLHILPATRMEWSFSLCKCKQLEHYIGRAVSIFIHPVVASSLWSLFCFSSTITNLFDSSASSGLLWLLSLDVSELKSASAQKNWKAPSPFLVLVQLASSTYADESIVRIRNSLECVFMTYILGFAVNVTERATWPFCDMRRRHSSKVFERRALNRNDSASKSAQGEVLWDHLTQACFWLLKKCICFWQRYQPTRVCTAHMD